MFLSLEVNLYGQFQEVVDLSSPITKDGKSVTFGFEAEFRGPNAKDVLTGGDGINATPDIKKFPFLDLDLSQEASGNLEIRSLGGDTKFSDVKSQMEKIKKTLGQDLKSFHLHIRIPKNMLEGSDKKDLLAWYSRISDLVYTWRVEHRHPFFSLQTVTLKRNSPHTVAQRGAIRAIELDDVIDFEIRGYMKDIDQIEDTLKIFMGGVKNPTLIQGHYLAQSFISPSHSTDIVEHMNQFLLDKHRPKLTQKQSELFSDLEQQKILIGSLTPFSPWDKATFLSDEEKINILKSQNKFKDDLWKLLQNFDQGYYSSKKVLFDDIRNLIKQWSKDINLHQTLRKSLLTPASLSLDPIRYYTELLKDSNPEIKKVALDYLTELVDPPFQLIELGLKDSNPAVVELALKGLKGKNFYTLKKYLASSNSQLKIKAIEQLAYYNSKEAIDLLENYAKGPSYEIRLAVAKSIKSLNRPKLDKRHMAIIKRLVNDPYELVASTALKAVKADGLAFLKEVYSNNPKINIKKTAAYQLVNLGPEGFEYFFSQLKNESSTMRLQLLEYIEIKDPKILPYLKIYLKDENLFVRSSLMQMIYNSPLDVSELLQVLAYDDEFMIRKMAIDSLLNRGEQGMDILQKLMDSNYPHFDKEAKLKMANWPRRKVLNTTGSCLNRQFQMALEQTLQLLDQL